MLLECKQTFHTGSDVAGLGCFNLCFIEQMVRVAVIGESYRLGVKVCSDNTVIRPRTLRWLLAS